ncbi:MAG: hypothetical protein R2795_16885 [Saprospiraceae bacterium]
MAIKLTDTCAGMLLPLQSSGKKVCHGLEGLGKVSAASYKANWCYLVKAVSWPSISLQVYQVEGCDGTTVVHICGYKLIGTIQGL